MEQTRPKKQVLIFSYNTKKVYKVPIVELLIPFELEPLPSDKEWIQLQMYQFYSLIWHLRLPLSCYVIT